VWACFPEGPLERPFEEGIQVTDLQEGVKTLLGRDIFGEASANYLFRCFVLGKVASRLDKTKNIPVDHVDLS
jgi:hypothetical protein